MDIDTDPEATDATVVTSSQSQASTGASGSNNNNNNTNDKDGDIAMANEEEEEKKSAYPLPSPAISRNISDAAGGSFAFSRDVTGSATGTENVDKSDTFSKAFDINQPQFDSPAKSPQNAQNASNNPANDVSVSTGPNSTSANAADAPNVSNVSNASDAAGKDASSAPDAAADAPDGALDASGAAKNLDKVKDGVRSSRTSVADSHARVYAQSSDSELDDAKAEFINEMELYVWGCADPLLLQAVCKRKQQNRYPAPSATSATSTIAANVANAANTSNSANLGQNGSKSQTSANDANGATGPQQQEQRKDGVIVEAGDPEDTDVKMDGTGGAGGAGAGGVQIDEIKDDEKDLNELNVLNEKNGGNRANGNDVETAQIGDEASDGDAILEPMRLVCKDENEMNFNQLCAGWNSAAIWRRDNDSFLGWGENEEGNIGDGNGNKIDTPTQMTLCSKKMIRTMSLGENHTAFIQPYGGLYVFGCNEEGQCGVDPDVKFRVQPEHVLQDIKDAEFCQVECGSGFTVALARHGTVYTFGRNDNGQLGRLTTLRHPAHAPSAVQSLYYVPIVEIACGERHCLARTRNDRLYAWGKGNHGQLGTGDVETRKLPTEIQSMRSEAMMQLACGSTHSVVLTHDSKVFTFGNNHYGQCGVDLETKNVLTPHNIDADWKEETLTQVDCGSYHTLITDGKSVWAFGHNIHGQCTGNPKDGGKICEPKRVDWFGNGLNNHQNDKIVVRLGGTTFSTIMLTADCDELFCDAEVQKYGIETVDEMEVVGPVDIADINGINGINQDKNNDKEKNTKDKEEDEDVDMDIEYRGGKRGKGRRLMNMSDEFRITLHRIPSNKSVRLTDHPLLYKLRSNDFPYSISIDQINSYCGKIENQKQNASIAHLASVLHHIFGSPSCLNQSFPFNSNMFDDTIVGSGFDYQAMLDTYKKLLNISNDLTNRLTKALLTVSRRALRYVDYCNDASCLRFYFLLLPFPEFTNGSFNHHIFENLNNLFTRIIRNNNVRVYNDLVYWVSTMDLSTREAILTKLQDCMNMYLEVKEQVNQYIYHICSTMKIMYESNKLCKRDDRIKEERFYNCTLSRAAFFNFKQDYINWMRIMDARQKRENAQAARSYSNLNNNNNCNNGGITSLSDWVESGLFSFCEYSFLLDPVAKREIIRTEQEISRIEHARRSQGYQMMNPFGGLLGGMNMFIPMAQPYFVLAVKRARILEDTMRTVSAVIAAKKTDEFFKELKIVFDGEEGVDQGGVKKEFFQLIVREMFDVKYGTFVYNEETRCYWFNQHSLETESEYGLIGIIIGLAIYNGVLLDIHFPKVIWKKLTNSQSLSYKDLYSFDPSIGKSMDFIKNYECASDEEMENALCLTFSVDYEVYGEKKTYELCEGGKDKFVNLSNRNEYIRLMTRYYLVDSISKQYDAFSRGLRLVLRGYAFSMFGANELEMLVIGNETLDFDALEVGTQYDGGYHSDHRAVRYLWSILKNDLCDEDKKKFLFFVTGSDRAPLRGLGKLGMKVIKVGSDPYDGTQLPTSHTCFNALMLPAYKTKDEMREKLLVAIQYAEGFGLQ